MKLCSEGTLAKAGSELYHHWSRMVGYLKSLGNSLVIPRCCNSPRVVFLSGYNSGPPLRPELEFRRFPPWLRCATARLSASGRVLLVEASAYDVKFPPLIYKILPVAT